MTLLNFDTGKAACRFFVLVAVRGRWGMQA